MRAKAFLLALMLLFTLAAYAASSPEHSASIAACPSGNPSPNGSQIVVQTAGVNSCILTDNYGNRWRFQGQSLFINSGSSFQHFADWVAVLQTNNGGGAVPNGTVFLQGIPPSNAGAPDGCGGVFKDVVGAAWAWRSGGDFDPAFSPTKLPSPPPFFYEGSPNHYFWRFGDMAFTPPANTTMDVGPPQQSGQNFWGGASRVGGGGVHITLKIAANSGIGCGADPEGAVLQLDASKGDMDFFTVKGLGQAQTNSSRLAYGGRQNYCFNPVRSKAWTIINTYISGCYQGVLSNDSGPEMTGTATSGSNTITDLVVPVTGTYVPRKPTDSGGWAVGMHIWDRDGHLPYASNITITELPGNNTATLSASAVGSTDATDTFIVDDPLTMTGVLVERNGDWYGDGGSATHNVYNGGLVPGDTARLVISNSSFLCQSGVVSDAGFEYKTRYVAGTFTGVTFAGVDHTGSITRCSESAAVDLSCGGNYTFGGTGTGQGVVFEVGPGIWDGKPSDNPNGFDVVRYDRDGGGGSTGNVDCGGNGAGGANYNPPMAGLWPDQICNDVLQTSAGCSLLIQNAWIINDSIVNLFVVNVAANVPTGRVVVKNSKLVENLTTGRACNSPQSPSPCGVFRNITMGAGNSCTINDPRVTDGGGNTCFTSRSAAGLPPAYALPPPM